ncbi:MAG: hypothetical protein HAW63_01795 [Bdellovibrionaceae bacterium]|nr:hypothetical protein [Pseudobdellovibrionaceae bacterium]
MKTISFILFILFFAKTSLQAKALTFDLDFLPKETVLPLVEDRVFVKNKTILLNNQLSLGFGGGVLLTEALFNNAAGFLSLTYNFTELHGVSLNTFYRVPGLSDAGKKADQASAKFSLKLVPQLTALHYAIYKYTAYYGKISLSHDWVMNLTTSVNMGGGVAQYNDAKFPLVALNADQSFYFSSNFAFNVSLGLFFYKGPDFFCKDKGESTADQACVDRPPDPVRRITSKELPKEWKNHTYLQTGLIYLF